MSAIYRLSKSPKLFQLLQSNRTDFLPLARHVTMKVTPYKPPVGDHNERNEKFHRPQSPHLSIYAVQITSTLSISHRMTGGALAAYAFAFGGAALVLPNKLSYYIDALQAAHPGALTIYTLKVILAFPFCYHFCNGVRHLIWDSGRFLTNKGVEQTGYIMLASTVVSTLALMCV